MEATQITGVKPTLLVRLQYNLPIDKKAGIFYFFVTLSKKLFGFRNLSPALKLMIEFSLKGETPT